jgi:anti-anti-sigma factor
MTLTISTRRGPNATMMIEPEGAIEGANADQLTSRVRAVLAATKPSEIVVDLDAVPSIDDAGLGALASGFDQAAAHEARLTVVGARPEVGRQLRTHGLGDLLA